MTKHTNSDEGSEVKTTEASGLSLNTKSCSKHGSVVTTSSNEHRNQRVKRLLYHRVTCFPSLARLTGQTEPPEAMGGARTERKGALMWLLFKAVSAPMADVSPPLHLSSVATSSPLLTTFAFLPCASRKVREVYRRGLRSDSPASSC